MKVKRNLSGIYFRYKPADKWENWCFEDLPEEVQDYFLEKNSIEWTRSLAKQLAHTINEIGGSLDIMSE